MKRHPRNNRPPGFLSSDSRVDVLEADLRNLAARVESGFKDINVTLRNMGEAFSNLSKEMASRPQPIPFKEILTTAATILAVVAYINNFYEVQSTKNLAPVMEKLKYIEMRMDRSESRNANRN